MTHTKSYAVTVENSLPQPHVEYDIKQKNNILSGWLPFISAGVVAGCFLVCIILIGGTRVFLVPLDTNVGLIPTVKQGSLKVYPFIEGVSNGIDCSYSSQLPSKNLTATTNTLSNVLKNYPKSHENNYKNCWLENPSASSPCFFDSSWIADVCGSDTSYGYEESNGFFNPCFIMKFNETQDWTPLPGTAGSVPSSISNHYDHGFMPVHCFSRDASKLNITVYPPKGFSLLFFPVSKFDTQKYLAPLVAVKVDGIPKGRNVTVECSVITPDAFLLWNDGKVVIRFTSGA